MEVHLLDGDWELLGKQLRVELLARLRGEKQFPDPEGLRRQLARDLAEARRVLAGAEAEGPAREE